MYSFELIQTVRLITDVCLEIAPGENVLCITDSEEKMDVITLIAAECKMRGAETAVILLEPRKQHYHEPPRSIARAMRESDVVITMAYGELMHTRARKRSLRSRREVCSSWGNHQRIPGQTEPHPEGSLRGALPHGKDRSPSVRSFNRSFNYPGWN